jgi:hypothetical protein
MNNSFQTWFVSLKTHTLTTCFVVDSLSISINLYKSDSSQQARNVGSRLNSKLFHFSRLLFPKMCTLVLIFLLITYCEHFSMPQRLFGRFSLLSLVLLSIQNRWQSNSYASTIFTQYAFTFLLSFCVKSSNNMRWES